jgi:hypothetical protein
LGSAADSSSFINIEPKPRSKMSMLKSRTFSMKQQETGVRSPVRIVRDAPFFAERRSLHEFGLPLTLGRDLRHNPSRYARHPRASSPTLSRNQRFRIR